ncbi:hypothetical protein EUX98_g3064 [Antrodiella citrinella]|uniref:AB hydrolase-1 domain-containing protein n=1 Tax=Antrodiella citrinella TaxID=2447956 RepID=A0A4S4MXF7_9APHY|nr:hypothetical protein EUX98_g3064 [Antrodiella citrinella]
MSTTTNLQTTTTDPLEIVSTFIVWLVRGLLIVGDYALHSFRRRPRVDLYYCFDDAKAHMKVDLAELLKTRVPSLAAGGFREAWWLPIGDTQTIFSVVGDFSAVDPIVYERKHIQIADGGLLTIDISPPTNTHPIKEGELVVAVAHGLTGGSHEHYVRAALTHLTAPIESGGLGARAVVLNYRGCNGSPVITPRLYHAGSSDDYRTLVSYICHTFPQSTVFGLGFSLGGNIVAKYVGEEGANCPLSGAVVLANPWDFKRGSEHLEQGTFLNRLVYRYVMGGALMTLLNLHSDVYLSAPSDQLLVSHDYIRRTLSHKKLSLKEVDDLWTAPIWGYKDANDYYAHISSSKVVDNVSIPLLGINSRDDPMVADLTLPITEVERNPWIILAVTRGGGHMGWFEQNPDGTIGRWYVRPITEYFRALSECDLPARPKPQFVVSDNGWVRQEGRDDVAFVEKAYLDSFDTFSSGTGESKLFSGF